MKRRDFLTRTSAAALAFSALRSPLSAATAAGRPPRILLRSSWQSVNIGHTPGALSLLSKICPTLKSPSGPESSATARASFSSKIIRG